MLLCLSLYLVDDVVVSIVIIITFIHIVVLIVLNIITTIVVNVVESNRIIVNGRGEKILTEKKKFMVFSVWGGSGLEKFSRPCFFFLFFLFFLVFFLVFLWFFSYSVILSLFYGVLVRFFCFGPDFCRNGRGEKTFF